MLLKQMHAPDDVEEEYIRHLALFVRIYVCLTFYHCVFLQRRFVREVSSEVDVTYKNFRIWLDNSSPTEEMWDAIMTEDENFDYSTARVLQDETPPYLESRMFTPQVVLMMAMIHMVVGWRKVTEKVHDLKLTMVVTFLGISICIYHSF